MNLIKKDVYQKLDSDLKESRAISNLMEGFPPICKQDPLDLQLYFIHDHLQSTRENIQLEDMSDQMYGGALPVANSRKSKRKLLSEVEYLEDDPEQPSKKAKKKKASVQSDLSLPTIQEEARELGPTKVLSKRTRSGKEVEPSPPQPAQPTIPKRKRKPIVRKLKLAPKEDEEAK